MLKFDKTKNIVFRHWAIDFKTKISDQIDEKCRRRRVLKFDFSFLFFSLASHPGKLWPNFLCNKICIYHIII